MNNVYDFEAKRAVNQINEILKTLSGSPPEQCTALVATAMGEIISQSTPEDLHKLSNAALMFEDLSNIGLEFLDIERGWEDDLDTGE